MWEHEFMRQTPPDTETDVKIRGYITHQLELRKETKASFGRSVGISPYSLNRRFRGRFPFQADELRRIAELWDVTTDEIMRGPVREEGRK